MRGQIPHPRQMGPSVPESLEESRVKVHRWGYPIVFKFREHPGAHYEPHYHEKATTHYILTGQLQLGFPGDSSQGTRTLGVGDRCDIPAGETIKVRAGKDGCEYLVGSV
ncbi:hypothetical protein KEM52_000458 [Ascosphaera acerosa]|nr:hypothetical protein KEM52_000458 [Ascosphaera acerosa]